MIIEIRTACKEDVAKIAANARPADRDELWAAAFSTPTEAMNNGLKNSEEAYTGLIDGEPVCMWGIIRESLIGNVGLAWMVATTLADKHAMTFLRRSKPLLLEVMSKYRTVFNFVDVRNKRAINWLKFMGFVIEEPTPYGAMNLPFHRFSLTKREPSAGCVIRKCALAEIKSNRNFNRLAREYAAEGKLFNLPPSDEKLAVYTLIERSGFFHIFGAFDGDILIGFIALLIPIIPHYGVGVAVAESYFVGKKYRKRGAGIRLLRAAERHAQELKTPGVIISLPPESELFSALVKRDEYAEGNRAIYRKFDHA